MLQHVTVYGLKQDYLTGIRTGRFQRHVDDEHFISKHSEVVERTKGSKVRNLSKGWKVSSQRLGPCCMGLHKALVGATLMAGLSVAAKADIVQFDVV